MKNRGELDIFQNSFQVWGFMNSGWRIDMNSWEFMRILMNASTSPYSPGPAPPVTEHSPTPTHQGKISTKPKASQSRSLVAMGVVLITWDRKTAIGPSAFWIFLGASTNKSCAILELKIKHLFHWLRSLKSFPVAQEEELSEFGLLVLQGFLDKIGLPGMLRK